jgi:hypothetical protein
MEDFAEKFSAYSNKELLAILINESSYQSEAVAAARAELEKRNPGAEEMEILLAVVQNEKNQLDEKAEHSRSVSRKVKLISAKIAEAYEPVHVEGSSTDKTILYISTFLLIVFFYTGVTRYTSLYFNIIDFRFSPVTTIVSIISLVLPLFAAPFFYLKKKSGWVLAAAYFFYLLISTSYYLLKAMLDAPSEYLIYYPRFSIFELVAASVIFGMILYTLIKPKFREIYRVTGGTVIKTFVFSFFLFFLLFAFA